MMKRLKIHKSSYIFNAIATAILVGVFGIYYLFGQTSERIKQENLHANIDYIESITSNIAQKIESVTSGNIYASLKSSHALRESLEEDLRFLVTNRYKYIYVVDKKSPESKSFRFLLDGAKNLEEKSEFGEVFTPLNFEEWNSIYRLKKPLYFQHKEIESIWLTYLKPIVVDGEVEAIIVVDFSLEGHNAIVASFAKLNQSFEIAVFFFILIFFVIITFSYIDNKRLYEIESQSKEIIAFNDTLQAKVKEELAKNRQKDQQIIQQSRLAQMGEMVSMIAHQWRQPLSAISSTSATMTLQASLESLDYKKTIELSNKISNYAQHLSSTIDDFRDFFKPNKTKQNTTYTVLIESVLSIIETSINNKNIDIVKRLNSDEIFYSYPNELKQVILNLIKNAEDVLIEKEVQEPMIIIETQGNVLKISDNGGGIPEEIKDKIFDPYFSTKLEKEGTGLGLYMSKMIIEEHCGGELRVENTEVGALFTITLESKED